MKSLNGNLYPRDGYFFIDSDGARISGDTWAGVVRRVEGYRRRQGRPVGDVNAEVTAQACQRNPVICTEDSAAYQHELRKSSLKSRVLGWFSAFIAHMQQHPPTFSSETDARNRANVCAGCPLNTALPDGCSSCKAALNEMRKSVIGARFQDQRIHACNGTSEDLNTAVWIEQDRVENGALPGHCWRKRTV